MNLACPALSPVVVSSGEEPSHTPTIPGTRGPRKFNAPAGSMACLGTEPCGTHRATSTAARSGLASRRATRRVVFTRAIGRVSAEGRVVPRRVGEPVQSALTAAGTGVQDIVTLTSVLSIGAGLILLGVIAVLVMG